MAERIGLHKYLPLEESSLGTKKGMQNQKGFDWRAFLLSEPYRVQKPHGCITQKHKRASKFQLKNRTLGIQWTYT